MQKQKEKQTPALERPREQTSRRKILSRSSFLLGILLLAYLAGAIYASTVVYRLARRTTYNAQPDVEQVSAASLELVAAANNQASGDQAPRLAPASVSAPVQPDESPQAIQPSDITDRITVLLLGVDQRPDDPSPPRTDNMIVLTIDPKSGDAGMISLPRDLFVPIPGFDYSGKINTAYVVGEINHYPGGGGELAKKTVSEFLGYPIDYYVKINFEGFEKAVNLLGGVDVVVPKTIHDEEYPTMDYGYQTFHIEAGPQHLDGETALKYVRTRHADNDFERAKRQQQVLLAIKDKIVANKLLSTLRALDFVNVLADSVEHDIPATKIPEFIALASRMQLNSVNQLVIDTRFAEIDTDSPYGWILIPNRDKMRPAVDAFFSNQQIAAAADSPAAQPQPLPSAADKLAAAPSIQQPAQDQSQLARQQVQNDYQAQAQTLRRQLAEEGARVAVYNGTGDAVLANRAADWLQRQGYNVVEFGQADRSDYDRTVLVTNGKKPFTASNLQETFAVARNNIRQSMDNRDNVDLRLVIGRDFYLLVSN